MGLTRSLLLPQRLHRLGAVEPLRGTTGTGYASRRELFIGSMFPSPGCGTATCAGQGYAEAFDPQKHIRG